MGISINGKSIVAFMARLLRRYLSTYIAIAVAVSAMPTTTANIGLIPELNSNGSQEINE
jgi:hypothetical protein